MSGKLLQRGKETATSPQQLRTVKQGNFPESKVKKTERDPERTESSTLQTEWEAAENSREQTRSWVTKTKGRQIS